MTRLSDPQLVILSAAAQRDDLSVLPLPETLKIKGGAVDKVLASLKAKGLIDHLGTPRGDDPPPLRITRAGLEAIRVETEDDAPEAMTTADAAPTSAEAENATGAPAPASEVDGANNKRAKAKVAKGRGKKATTTAQATSDPEAASEPTAKPTPRAGTKQAQMIEMLRRPEGATVEQIAAATGWQHHTVRGAISGALKKKLGLTVEARRSAPTSVVGGGSQARRTREIGPNKTGAKGSTTVYRIIGSRPNTT